MARTVDHFTRFAVLAKEAPPSVPAQIFSDVAVSYWASDFINELHGLGCINGYPDGAFRPERPITRAEFTTVVVKALAMSEDRSFNLNFKDSEAIPNWAKGYIAAAVKAGLLNGYPDGALKPDNNIQGRDCRNHSQGAACRPGRSTGAGLHRCDNHPGLGGGLRILRCGQGDPVGLPGQYLPTDEPGKTGGGLHDDRKNVA